MNTPNINPVINPDDPKWTAYVLGECDETERAEIELLLKTSEEARALIEEITLATASMKEELSAMAPLMMTPEQRAAIRDAAKPAPRRWLEVFPMKWGLGLAAAAVLTLTVWVGFRTTATEQTGKVAQNVAVDESKVAGVTAPSSESAEPKAAEPKTLSEKMRAGAKELKKEQTTPVTGAVSVDNETPVLSRIAETQQDLKKLSRESLENSNTLRDGISVNGLSQGVAAGAPPPPPPAAVTAPVQIQTRSGTNTFAGSAAQGQQGQQAGQAQQGQQGQAGGAGGGRGGGRGGAPATGPGVAGGVAGGVIGGVFIETRTGAAPPPPAPPPPPPAALSVGGRIDRVNAPAPNTEAYDRVVDNPFVRTTQETLATFSIDVDTASYANVRRFLNQNQLPPRDAVRIEEMINYFNYDYAQPTGNAPIAPNMEVAATPWNPTNRLVRIGVKAHEVNANRRPPSNLVFLIDVSGSMNSPERLPLVKAGLNMLVERLGENDLVSIVVYAGNSGLVLGPTSGMRKEVIRQAIDSLRPGGSTNGASGIQLAYSQATLNFLKGGVNRVILMTDGDFNVGVTNQGDLTRLIEEKAKSGVFLSVLGFGMGNLKDSTMEKLADQGNGNYAYIDSLNEARKVLVEEMSGTLVTVAKDVKIQVDFNPAKVEAYRLIGYENRVLRTEDFNNDAKDAGDMGAGHTVTALFEVVPKGGEVPGPSIDPSKYTQPVAAAAANPRNAGASSNELLTLRVRYKEPDSDRSTRMDVPLVDRGNTFARATTDFRFAASVAEFGMILRDSPYKGSSRTDSVLDIAGSSQGQDRNGYRKEFISLVQKARNLER
jgi:Ca-activated chloride channel family protein